MKKAVIVSFALLVFIIYLVFFWFMKGKSLNITIKGQAIEHRQQASDEHKSNFVNHQDLFNLKSKQWSMTIGNQTNHSQKLSRTDTNLNPKGKPLNSSISFIHLVIQFPLLLNVSTNDKLFVRQRQLEYTQTLQRNLGHRLVKRVHILCENDQTVKFILQNFKPFAQKLVLKNIGRRMLYSDALAYVSDKLLFETAMIMNADLYLGKGFEKVSPNLLNGTVYALTRHESEEKIKACPGRQDFCTTPFRGSHDAFVMHLLHPVPDQLLEKTTFLPDRNGAENVFIYMLETYGHFRFKNPCSIVYIIHNHCVNKRTDFVGEERLESILKVPGRTVGFSGL